MKKDENTHEKIRSVKSKIEKLIENGHLEEAKTALDMYEEKMPGDQDICSMRAVIQLIEGNTDKAEKILLEGLKNDSVHFDLLYNLAYIYEQRGQLRKAAELYCKAGTAADVSQRINVDEALARLQLEDRSIQPVEKDKIVFFVKPGMDSFLDDIIHGLSDIYFVRKVIVRDSNQIAAGMEWADICWFEWCDELVAYGSGLQLAAQRKIVCRIHGYEVYSDLIRNVKWENVDQLIIVAPHIKRIFEARIQEIYSGKIKTDLVFCGINIDKYPLMIKNRGFNLGYLGYINYKKNIPLTLDIFKKLHDTDNRYKLYIAGQFQDERTLSYFKYFINEHGLSDSVFYEGWVDYEQKLSWLKKIDYMIISSIDEGLCFAAAEAMCSGIKPVLHNCEGIKDHYDSSYIFSTIDQAVEMITSNQYDSAEYRKYIENNYSLEKEVNRIKTLMNDLLHFKRLVNRAENLLHSNEKINGLLSSDLTVLIPSYNRAKILKEDIDRGLKLGNQPKLIVDDCSTKEIEWLEKISEDHKDGVSVIIKDKNGGVAESRHNGLHAINTKFTTFIDDDNIMLCIEKHEAMDKISMLEKDVSIIVPRYIVNYYKGHCSLGYDRQYYNGMSGFEVLRDLASTGEMMGLLTGGAIGETEWMRQHSSCRLFRGAGEDFVMLSRMMADRPEMRVLTSEGLVFIRRFLDEGLTMNPTPEKLALVLISQAIACYYCIKLKIAEKDEVLNWMRDRASLIQRIYNFGDGFETELISYLTGEISEEVFIHYLKLFSIKIENSLDELAPELKKMRGIFYTDTEKSYSFIDTAELPLVSIIIPTYNRKEMLKRAIDNALKQDYPNIEIIVSDNCSDDGTFEMVKENFGDEKRVIYHRNERNFGPTMNYTIAFYEFARGEYCMTQSDDDYLIDPAYISRAVKMLNENKELSFVFANYYYNHEGKNAVYRVRPAYRSKINGKDFFINFFSEKYPYMPNLCTTLFRRESAKDIQILKCDPNCLSADLSILLRLLLKGDAGFIDDIVLVYTLHKKSISLNPGTCITDEQDNYYQKALMTARADIEEMKKIGSLAHDIYGFTDNELGEWFNFRVLKYMYWRVNETVNTKQEAVLLLKFIEKEYPMLLNTLRNAAQDRFGEIVPEEG